jgi:hypothetical protein
MEIVMRADAAERGGVIVQPGEKIQVRNAGGEQIDGIDAVAGAVKF